MQEDIPLKQNLTVSQYPAYLYLTVAGTNLNFDISVTSCPTSGCTQERAIAAAISSKNFNIVQDSDP